MATTAYSGTPPLQVTNYYACDSGQLLYGDHRQHTLNVTFTIPESAVKDSMVWLDSLQYQPLPSDPLDAVMLRVHNSDPSFSYNNISGAWIQDIRMTGSNYTKTVGARVKFDFNGALI